MSATILSCEINQFCCIGILYFNPMPISPFSTMPSNNTAHALPMTHNAFPHFLTDRQGAPASALRSSSCISPKPSERSKGQKGFVKNRKGRYVGPSFSQLRRSRQKKRLPRNGRETV